VDKPTSSLPYFASRPRFLSRMKGAPWYHRYRRVSATRLCYPPFRAAVFVTPLAPNHIFCEYCGISADDAPSRFRHVCMECLSVICLRCTKAGISLEPFPRRDLYNWLPDRTFRALYTKLGRKNLYHAMRRAYRWHRTWLRKRRSHLIQYPNRLGYAHACRMARAQCVRAGYVQITPGLWFNPSDRVCYIQNHIVVPCDEVVAVVG
jgi:hypothetical protein